MQNALGISNWDGHLPPHIAKNEQVWWEVFPRIRADLPPKIFQLFGGTRESPSREIVGKVILVAETRAEMRAKFGTVGGSLLNHLSCYCNKMMDEWKMVYMAGTATDPILTFSVFPAALSTLVLLRFYGRIEKDPSVRDDLQKIQESMMDTLKELGGSDTQLQETEISVVSFKRGHWEDGLDTAFRAALWVCSNREEALASIWKVQAWGNDLRSL